MISERIFRTFKFSVTLFLFIAIALLLGCTSTHKVASSFSKRRYTKGHFYDPISKLKMLNGYFATTKPINKYSKTTDDKNILDTKNRD